MRTISTLIPPTRDDTLSKGCLLGEASPISLTRPGMEEFSKTYDVALSYIPFHGTNSREVELVQTSLNFVRESIPRSVSGVPMAGAELCDDDCSALGRNPCSTLWLIPRTATYPPLTLRYGVPSFTAAYSSSSVVHAGVPPLHRRNPPPRRVYRYRYNACPPKET